MVKQKMSRIVVLFLSLLFLTSCLTPSLNSCKGSCPEHQEPSLFPLQSFVKLVTYLDGKAISSGSGAVIHKDAKGSYILTAAHVCQNNEAMFVSILAQVPLETKLLDLDGAEHLAKTVAIDVPNDICLMRSTSIKKPALKLSKSSPVLGDKYFNMAAPLGWSSAWVVPMFEGYFSGTIKLTSNSFSIYTIPVQGGSSGSPIFNEKGEVVGMIVARAVRMENLALSPTYKSIKVFLEKAIAELEKEDQ